MIDAAIGPLAATVAVVGGVQGSGEAVSSRSDGPLA